MARTREWVKLGSLAVITVALAVGFLAAVDLPARSFAQGQPTALVDRPAPVPAASGAVADLGNAFTAVAEAVRPAVVYIKAERRSGPRPRPDLPPPFDRFFDFDRPEDIPPQPQRGQGSGFLITPDGYIMTNNHVVEGFDRLTVELFDGRQFDARVVGRDPNTDIAVIRIEARSLPAVAFGNSDSLRIGEWVLAIGNPLGTDFSFTVTAGIVSGRGRLLVGLRDPDRQWAIHDFIQTDAAINPGNSGGPLVNIRGQVVAVNSAIASATRFYSGYSFAIPINLARTVADQLIREGKVTRAALGIRVEDAGPLDAEAVGLDSVRGVLVKDFAGDRSPAKQAGLKVGDVIVEVDGERIYYTAQLQQLVGFKQPGSRVNVVVLREDSAGIKRVTIPVRLMEAETTEVATLAGTGETGMEGRTAYQVKLGVDVAAVDQRLAARLAEEHRGLVVTAVDPDGPAREALVPANVAAGVVDVITHVNGRRVQTAAELDQALDEVRPGGIVSLRLYRLRGRAAQPDFVRLRTRRGN